MKRTLVRLGLATLVTSALFGCGGGSDGINGVASPTNTVPNTFNILTVASNKSTPTSASVAAWKALAPVVTVNSVTIGSAPVVKFTVADAAGTAMVGLGNSSKSSSASVASLVNLKFTLAKLVPATGTAPSTWMSYLVLKPPTAAQVTGAIAATDSCTADKKWCGTYPTTEAEGTLVDNGDGTYQYTFARDITQVARIVTSLVDSTDKLKKGADLGDVSYNPAVTHRLGIQISGAAPGTGTNVPNATQVIPGVNIAIPANTVYDFRPDGQAVTSTRNIVDIASCASCHNGKGLAHGAGRKDPNYCVTCHTDQIKYGMSGEATRASALVLNGTIQNTTSVVNGRAVGNYPNFVHKIHMGDKLSLTGYNFIPTAGVGLNFNENEWIQDPRNCTKCHSGVDKTDINQATKTKDGDNWMTKPSRLACASCHDNVDFVANTITTTAGTTSHSDAAMTDDSRCSTCHTSAAIAEYHRTEAPTANNPVVVNGVSTISYEIKSVTLNATQQPVFTFRIIKDGSPVTTFAAAIATTNATATSSLAKGALAVPSTFEAIPGFQSGPSFYMTYAVSQDGITSPADFNTYQSVSLTNLLVPSGSPKAGTLTGPDSNGYFAATLTGDLTGQVTGTCTSIPSTVISGKCVNPSPIVIPTTGKMVTGAMIGTFKQVTFTGVNTVNLTAKFNATNGTVSKGLIIKTSLKKLLASGITGNAARRIIVEADKCEACHEQLGTAVEFHGGARNDPTACAICHTTSKTSNGWSANASTYIHGIHAGTSPTSVAAAKVTNGTPATNFAVVGNPGSGVGGAGAVYSEGKRTIPFSWARDQVPTVAGFNAAAVVYPGILKRCDNCHVPNAVNFGASGPTVLPNLLWSTSAAGVFNASTDTKRIYPRDPVTGAVAYITADNVKNYGNVFSYVPEGAVVPVITPASGTKTTLVLAGTGGVKVPADAETLVESPITSACFACHDASLAKAHMTQNGGVIYGRRGDSTVAGSLVNKETCLVCHGMGRDQDVAAVHAK